MRPNGFFSRGVSVRALRAVISARGGLKKGLVRYPRRSGDTWRSCGAR
jgi:hypothetical protein